MAKEKLQALNLAEQEEITAALVRIIKQNPIFTDTRVQIEDVQTGGIGVFPQQGAVYLERYVNGGFLAQYPFYLVYRAKAATEAEKVEAPAKLEALAEWICLRPVEVRGKVYKLAGYPDLTGGREIEEIERTSTVFTGAVDGSSDSIYRVNLTLEYFKN